jgi:hypothetical protein
MNANLKRSKGFMIRRHLAFAGIVFGLFATRAAAQLPDDEVAATVAALPAILAKVQAAPAILVYNDRTAQLASKLSLRLGKAIAHESTMISCKNQGNCALKEPGSLVNLGGTTVTGNRAEVWFSIEDGAPTVGVETYLVTLTKVNGVWTVGGVVRMAIS